jgi:hypothetical protein
VRRGAPYLGVAFEKWACERVFLGALVCADKYLHDEDVHTNKNWASCTQVFGVKDIGLVEREYLDLLAYKLSVSEAEILPFSADIHRLVHPTQLVDLP